MKFIGIGIFSVPANGDGKKGFLTITLQRGDKEITTILLTRASDIVAQKLSKNINKIIMVEGDLDVELVNGVNAPVLYVTKVTTQPNTSSHYMKIFGVVHLTQDAVCNNIGASEWKVINVGVASNRKTPTGDKSSFFKYALYAKTNADDGKNRLDNLVGYFGLGQGLFVDGELRVEEYKSKEDGSEKTSIVIVDTGGFQFVGASKKRQQDDSNSQMPTYAQVGKEKMPAYADESGQVNGVNTDENQEEIPF